VTLHDTLARVMLAIALRQPDPREREAMIAIMRKDGFLPKEADKAA
jgi:hypothetical protein